MIDFMLFGLTGCVQVAFLMAAMFNFTNVRWTTKQVLITTSITYIPFMILKAISGLNISVMYAWVLFVILAVLVVFKLSWRQSIFIGIFINFIYIIADYFFILTVTLFPKATQAYLLENLFIARIAMLIFYMALYVFSRKFKDSDYPPLAHFATVHWILYFLIFSLFADSQMANLYEQTTIQNAPELVIIGLFSIFFLYNLISLRNLSSNITKRIEAEFHAEALQKELEAQEFYNAALKDVLDDLSGFRHEFSNTVGAINSYVNQKNLHGLENYMKKHTTTIITSAALEIIEPLRHFSVLFSLLSSTITSAQKKDVEFLVTIMCAEPDIKYCSVVDYGLLVGNLLDNALEAARKSNDKMMQFDILIRNGRLATTVMNSCDEEVDIDCIFERKYSSKDTPSGEGLYQVKRILQKYKENKYDIQLITTFENKTFTQELII